MVGSIQFPHLGIRLEHVIKSVSIGGFEIACYGMVLAAAMATGILLTMRVARKTGQDADAYFDLGIIAIIVSVICARIYYVVFSWSYYRVHPAEIFNLRGGGLAIYGGVIGGVLTVFVFARVRRMSFFRLLDTAAVGLVWGQMVGRWGNFFNREAFGEYTDGLLAMRLPAADVRSYEITELMRRHMQTIGGVDYIQVHPTFLYESLWNLGVLAVLLLLTFLVKKRFDGMVFLFYLLLYGTGRFWIEGLRTDQLLLPGSGLPVSQVLSGILVLAAAALLITGTIHRRNGKRSGKGTEHDESERTFDKTH